MAFIRKSELTSLENEVRELRDETVQLTKQKSPMRALLGNCMGTLPLQLQYTLFGYSCQYAFAVKLLRFCKQEKVL